MAQPTVVLYNPETRGYETVEIGSARYDELRAMAQEWDAMPQQERVLREMEQIGVETTTDDGQYRIVDPVTGQVTITSSPYGATGAVQTGLAMTGQLHNQLGFPGLDQLINQYADRAGNNASPWGGGTAMPYWYTNPDGSPGPLTSGGSPPQPDPNNPGAFTNTPGAFTNTPWTPPVNTNMGSSGSTNTGGSTGSSDPAPARELATAVARSWSNTPAPQNNVNLSMGGRSLGQPIQRSWSNVQPNDPGGQVSQDARNTLAAAVLRSWR